MPGDLAAILIGFFAAGGIVVYAGVHLTRAGDDLGEILKLGGSWIGLVVLSAITSLPELVASIGSSAWQGQPNLACGNVFGSNSFNIFIIAILDLFLKGGPISYRFGVLPSFSGGLGILMTGLGAMVILFNQPAFETAVRFPDWFWSALIAAGYISCMVMLYRFEKRSYREKLTSTRATPTVDASIVGESKLKPVIQKMVFSAFFVVLAGLGMVYLADQLAVYPFAFGQLGHTFVGSLGLALATSLPELVVGVTALKMGKFDLATGNLFGSNIFNILILAISQLTFAPFHSGVFYGGVELLNLMSALLAMMLSGVAIAGLMYRSERSFFRLGWDSATILVLYAGGTYLLFLLGH
jgi:cation:H+ antiporter